VDPAAKADEIYTFLVGKPVFKDMDGLFRGMAFQPVPVN
jgi:iron complex transport system substrate-binding protein